MTELDEPIYLRVSYLRVFLPRDLPIFSAIGRVDLPVSSMRGACFSYSHKACLSSVEISVTKLANLPFSYISEGCVFASCKTCLFSPVFQLTFAWFFSLPRLAHLPPSPGRGLSFFPVTRLANLPFSPK